MRNPNAKNLALRDPALAALVGAIGNEHSDFGGDDDDYMGYEFGDDYGYEFGDDAPHPAAAAAAWQKERAGTERRALLLEPNKNSRIKVQRYTFSASKDLTLATPASIDITQNPDTHIRPQRVTANVPAPGMVTISDLKVANVSVGVGGTLDAFQFNANGVGQSLDMPSLTPANRVRVQGNYTGSVPSPLSGTGTFTFIMAFTGPAKLAA